jgi:NhaP-type Na+/H+ or K+/H+ antiporter
LILAGVLFLVVRPLSAVLLLAGTPTTQAQRGLMAWFGIRGIGSLYYLTYAVNHQLSGQAATDVVGLTVSVVALSILVHGLTMQPIMRQYERLLERST